MKNSFSKTIFSLIGGILLTTSPILGNDHIKSHSIKTLNVTGEEMALIQFYLPGAHVEIKIEDEMIGLSKKENLISLYVDLDKIKADARQEIQTVGYSKEPEKIKEVLSKVFHVKETQNSVSLSLKN